jgi:glycine hydroxymethyltransferase
MCKEGHLKGINRSVFPGTQGGPLMHIVAAKAVCFGEALKPDYKAYGQAVVDNAKALAETLVSLGLSLVSGGTDNHLMLVDVTSLGLGGKKAEAVLDQCGITVNMNMIPFDQRKPMDPSGIRIGTPALTTRRMGTEEMKQVGQWIHQALSNSDDESVLSTVRGEVKNMCESFPVPADREA